MEELQSTINNVCMSQFLFHYRGYRIVHENGLYRVPELFKTFLSSTEAIKQIDKDVKETIVNLKTLNGKTNQTTFK